MTESLQNILLPIVSALGAGFTTWIFARRKNTAEAEGTELDNVEKGLSIYFRMIKQLEEKINLQDFIIEKQNQRITLQSNEIHELKEQLNQLQKRTSE